MVADGLDEVRLAVAGVSVDKKRVVDSTWLLDDGLSSRVSELVEWSDDK